MEYSQRMGHPIRARQQYRVWFYDNFFQADVDAILRAGQSIDTTESNRQHTIPSVMKFEARQKYLDHLNTEFMKKQITVTRNLSLIAIAVAVVIGIAQVVVGLL